MSIFTTDTLALVEQTGAALIGRGATVVTAESCTGGLVAAALTAVGGSSRYTLGGIVAYGNEVKQRALGVDEKLLVAHGAVSAPVAQAMAAGARQVLGADYALSVTGIAGPGGGSPEKPVGLTFIGLAGPGDLLTARRFVWEGDRTFNRAASVDAALRLLLEALAAQ